MIRQIPHGYGLKIVKEEGSRTEVLVEVGPLDMTDRGSIRGSVRQERFW